MNVFLTRVVASIGLASVLGLMPALGAIGAETRAASAAEAQPLSVEQIFAKRQPPGAQILVVDHGRVIEERNIGSTDLKTKRPVDAHTRFEVGSVTKQFTAAAIVQLEEHGKLSLSDPLGKWVPQYEAGRAVTLEQLLRQVSGIPNYTDTAEFRKTIAVRDGRVVSQRIDLDGALAFIAKEPLDFAPGSAWEYSNTNYVLLAAVVAAASGTPWREYVRKNLFGPGGMTESLFAGEAVPGGDLATGYLNAEDKLLPADPDHDEGDGGVVSTAHDLAKWNDALFGGKIVSAKGLSQMTTPGSYDAGSGRYGFGLKLDSYDGVRRISHEGSDTGFQAVDQVYPSLSQQVIVLTSSYDTDASGIADAAFDQHHLDLFATSAGVGDEDPSVTTLVKRVWSGRVTGNIDVSLLTPKMATRVPQWKADTSTFAAYGGTARWIFLGESILSAGGPRFYQYRLMFASGKIVDFGVSLNSDRQVAGLFFSFPR